MILLQDFHKSHDSAELQLEKILVVVDEIICFNRQHILVILGPHLYSLDIFLSVTKVLGAEQTAVEC